MTVSASLPAPPRARSVVLAPLAALAICVAVGYGLIALVVLSDVVSGQSLTDWVSFYSAASLVREGDGARLYDLTAQAGAQRAVFGPTSDFFAFALPAFVAIVLAPLSTLPFAASYFVWLALNLALVAVFARIACRYLDGVPRRALLIACAAASTPVFLCLLNAQVDLFVLASILGCYALLRRDRPLGAGAVLALALVKPHVAAAFVLLLIVKGEWRALAAFAVVGATLLLGPALLFGPGVLRDQIALLSSFPSSSANHVSAEMMVNVRGAVTSVTGSSNVWLWAIPLAAIAIVSGAAAMRVWRARSAPDAQSWAIAMLLPLLYSPHMHVHTVVLALAAGMMYARARAASGRPITAEAILAVYCGLAAIWALALLGVALMFLPLLAVFAVFTAAWPAAAVAQPSSLSSRPELPLAA